MEQICDIFTHLELWVTVARDNTKVAATLTLKARGSTLVVLICRL